MLIDHELKILPKYFEPIQQRLKTFEIRNNVGRNYKVGQVVKLREWLRDMHTGQFAIVRITYVTDYGQMSDTVVWSFEIINIGKEPING